MKCPHCNVEIHAAFFEETLGNTSPIGKDSGNAVFFYTKHMVCPACFKAIIYLQRRIQHGRLETHLVYPNRAARPKAHSDVPNELSEHFNESCLVLNDSSKASAALSRRCLQHLLELQGYAHKDLGKAIEAVLTSKTLPASLARNLDAIRNIGNFAAHPTKDTNSGSIVEVEPEEAEWNLEVLEGLFEFYYVQPAIDQAKIDALNAKLSAAGKPAMKKAPLP
jgi:hypothetical protein